MTNIRWQIFLRLEQFLQSIPEFIRTWLLDTAEYGSMKNTVRLTGNLGSRGDADEEYHFMVLRAQKESETSIRFNQLLTEAAVGAVTPCESS